MAHIRIENEYWRTPEFIKFTAGNEYRVLMFLIAHIVRVAEEDIHPAGAVRMRKNYFDKGKLCASYSMENIARIFGWGSEEKPNKSHVSRIIKRLEDMGLLEKIVENTPKGRKYVYQLGYYEGLYDTDSYEEHLYFDEYFGKKAKQHKQKKVDSAELEKENEAIERARKRTKWFEKGDQPAPPKNSKYDWKWRNGEWIQTFHGWEVPKEFANEEEKDMWRAFVQSFEEFPN